MIIKTRFIPLENSAGDVVAANAFVNYSDLILLDEALSQFIRSADNGSRARRKAERIRSMVFNAIEGDE